MDIWETLIAVAEKQSVLCLLDHVERNNLQNAVTENGKCILSIALERNWPPLVVNEMLKAGCNVDLWRDEDGNTLLHYAVKKKCSTKIFKLLVSAVDAATIHTPDRLGRTVLHVCCTMIGDAYTKYAQIVLDRGGSLYTLTKFCGRNCLHLAVMSANISMIKSLITDKRLLNARDLFQRSPIFYAKEYEVLKTLVRSCRDTIDFWLYDNAGISVLNAVTMHYEPHEHEIYKCVRLFYKYDLLDNPMHGHVFSNVTRARSLVRWAAVRTYIKTHKFTKERNTCYLYQVAKKLNISPLTKMSVKQVYRSVCQLVFQPGITRIPTINDESLTAEKIGEIPSEYLVIVQQNNKNYFFDWRNISQLENTNAWTKEKFTPVDLFVIQQRNVVLDAIGVTNYKRPEHTTQLICCRLESIIATDFFINANTYRVSWLFEEVRKNPSLSFFDFPRTPDGIVNLFDKNCTGYTALRELKMIVELRCKFESIVFDLREMLDVACDTAFESVTDVHFATFCRWYHEEEAIKRLISPKTIRLLVSNDAGITLKRLYFVEALRVIGTVSLVIDRRKIRQRALMLSDDIICS